MSQNPTRSQKPTLAIVLEGGSVQSLIVEDWPRALPLPLVALVDYDIDEAAASDITHFSIAGESAQALCHTETPLVFEQYYDVLSPRAVLAAMEASGI